MFCEQVFIYGQLLLYRTLGYTGIRTYRTGNFSPARRNSSQYVLYSPGKFAYTGFLIYRTQNLSPNRSLRYKSNWLYMKD